MKMLENLVKGLDREDMIQLVDILKKSIIKEEMDQLKEQYGIAEQKKDFLSMITIKGRMGDLRRER